MRIGIPSETKTLEVALPWFPPPPLIWCVVAMTCSSRPVPA